MRTRTYISVALLAAVASACSQLSSPSSPSSVNVPGATSAPAPAPSATGATINGVVLGNVSGSQFTTAAAGLTVTIVGTSVTATVEGNGQFTLRNTPTGQVQLRFTGPGVDAVLTIQGVGDRDEIRITVRVSGSTAQIEDHRNESPDHGVELEGRLTDVNVGARTLRVGDTLVNVPAGTPIRHGDTPVQFASLRVGDRVHVKGTALGSAITASEIKLQTDNSGPGKPDDGDDDDEEEDDDAPKTGRVELNGALAGLGGGCPTISFTVSGSPVATNRDTDFHDGACSTLKNGDRVEVKGTRQTNGTVLASKVEKKK